MVGFCLFWLVCSCCLVGWFCGVFGFAVVLVLLVWVGESRRGQESFCRHPVNVRVLGYHVSVKPLVASGVLLSRKEVGLVTFSRM